MVAVRMCRQEPLHPPPEVAIAVRTHDQVEVIWHQTIPKQIQPEPLLGIGHGSDERIKIGGCVKDSLTAVTAVKSVIDHASHRGASSAWHCSDNDTR
jgi:hypothetical protein